jgi:hypothetical protein
VWALTLSRILVTIYPGCHGSEIKDIMFFIQLIQTRLVGEQKAGV